MYQYASDLSLGCISDVLLERVRLIINVDCDVVNIMSVSEVSIQSRQSIITPVLVSIQQKGLMVMQRGIKTTVCSLNKRYWVYHLDLYQKELKGIWNELLAITKSVTTSNGKFIPINS